MKVSILVPVYNVERYIARCAESLFNQTHNDIEYLFVDDCTPDRSIDVLRSVVGRYPRRKGQVRILRNAANSGIGAVRQRLIDESTGECVTFVDSDDYLPPRAVELLCAEMERSGADMVDGAWQRVTQDGVSPAILPYQGHDTRRYLGLMLCQNIVSNRMWGRLYRRRLFTDNGIRLTPGIDYAEDYSVMSRVLFYASRSFINDPVYFYSDENAASYTHTTSTRHVRSYLRSCRVVLDFYTKNDTEGRYLTPLQLGMANAIRNVRRIGFSLEETDSLLGYTPHGPLFRLVAAMLRGRCPYRLAEALYLAARKMFIGNEKGDNKQ